MAVSDLTPSTTTITSNDDSELTTTTIPPTYSPKPLAVLSDHDGAVSSLALCGEFLLSASHARDIIAWQHPDLRLFARFGAGSGSVKSLAASGILVFTAHQDTRIRIWKVSRSSHTALRLLSTLPTPRDYLSNFTRRSNYVHTSRNHRIRLWIQHSDTISCLAVDSSNNILYSGSWDRTIKVWRLSDFRCIESIEAHDDAINALAIANARVYSASADGKIKIWGKSKSKSQHSLMAVLGGGGGTKVRSWNAVVVCEEGRVAYGGGSDGKVMGWDEEGRVVCDVQAHGMAVLCLCATEGFVCSGSADRSIAVWRRRGGGGGLERVGVMRGHEGPVKCLQASWNCVGEGFLLYSGGLDKSLRVWWMPLKVCGGNKEEMEKSCILMR